jgi:hypothetical protein
MDLYDLLLAGELVDENVGSVVHLGEGDMEPTLHHLVYVVRQHPVQAVVQDLQ